MRDEDDLQGPGEFTGGPHMAFGPVSRQLAAQGAQRPPAPGEHAHAVSTVGVALSAHEAARGALGPVVGRTGVVAGALSAGSGVLAIRAVRNGWVVDDGRGMEMVATSPEEAAGIALDWMRQRVRARQDQDARQLDIRGADISLGDDGREFVRQHGPR